jgi:hypothetical protein
MPPDAEAHEHDPRDLHGSWYLLQYDRAKKRWESRRPLRSVKRTT